MNHDPEMLLLALDIVKKERDAALARAEKAEAWIETHFEYLGNMETGLCAHGGEDIPVSVIREWFNTLVWFNVATPEATTAEKADDVRG